MKPILSFSLLLFSILSFSQIKFHEGYLVMNDKVKKSVFIKNMDWKEYPEVIHYKETADGDTKQATISAVKEFYVDDITYVRYDVKVDNSAITLNSMDANKDPIWIKKTVFLKLLVDGKTKLYKYSQNGNVKYFIKKEGRDNVEQLIFKQYLSEQQSQSIVKSNNNYKKQLDSINSAIPAENLKYEEKSLAQWFNQNSGIVDIAKSSNGGKFNMRAKVGFLSSQFSFESSSSMFQDVNLDSKITVSPSLEMEYVLAFNKGKWSIFAEPTYSNYSSELLTESTVFLTFINRRSYKVDYQSIIIPMGVKHYMFVNDRSKFFISGAFVVSIPMQYRIEVSSTDTGIPSYEDNPNSTAAGFQLGVGYIYNNKWSVEGRLINQKSGISNETTAITKSVGLSIGYNIF
ncbi:outer membrane beta-barrel protein [Epilithonimonas tenax]|uniref:outer membrane beta-barrel protein n=1 Tax=Epilithonimonas tenax TaxID=191577 RepID=UPI00040501B1|nr:outer membrane beta-barrel protein [Epilithonimonas tenax]